MKPLVFGRSTVGDLSVAESREWLVTNGLGSFASGTLAGTQTRRYHGLLIAALEPPLARTLLVSAPHESATYDGLRFDLASARWRDGTLAPAGYVHVERWYLDGTTPVWEFALGDALLEKRIWMEHGSNTTYVRYANLRSRAPLALEIRAFCDARDFHATMRAGAEPLQVTPSVDGFRVDATVGGRAVSYDVSCRGTEFVIDGRWYRDFLLQVERERGLDDLDDHFCAGVFVRTLARGESIVLVASLDGANDLDGAYARKTERERALLVAFGQAHGAASRPAWLERCALAADQFVVARPSLADPAGVTVIAGYPWFGDWGRDTMISLPGLTLATGRPEIARAILTTFARYVDGGMLPNALPEPGAPLEYNTVDAALWYVEAVAAYVEATGDTGCAVAVWDALWAIVDGYCAGTRFGIVLDTDGLIRAGVPGSQVTWMDARVDDKPVTPRMGKPVEISALWYNALRRLEWLAPQVARESEGVRFARLADATQAGFARFWSPERAYLYDVLDTPDGDDATLRPNQLFAVSLPHSALDALQRRAVVVAAQAALYASRGVRTLDPRDPRYAPSYGGPPAQRDAAYHQGTSWTWLLGAFVSAHARAFGDPAAARAFLAPIGDALTAYAAGTLAELTDGDAPFAPRGAIAQAWSVAEVLRAWYDVERVRA